MMTWEEVRAELAEHEGVYTLLLTDDHACSTLRALQQAPADDVGAAGARERLARLLGVPPSE